MQNIIKNVNIVNHNWIFYWNIIFSDKIEKIEILWEENKKCSKYLFPWLIDPHVHFRDPWLVEKEDCNTWTLSALAGWVTTIFDMPNTKPLMISTKALDQKIDIYTKNANCNWKLFLWTNNNNFSFLEENINNKNISWIKIFLWASTWNLLVEKEKSLEKIFKFASEKNAIISLHCEDNRELINALKDFKWNRTEPISHSLLRPKEAAIKSTEYAISLSKKYWTKINICHLSTKEELILVKNAKKEWINVKCEAAPHHLFLNMWDYEKYWNLIQMNPPVREKEDNMVLFEWILNWNIDFIWTDHAPHIFEEKNVKEYWKTPSWVPWLETWFPLLLREFHSWKIKLEQIVKIMSFNASKFWDLNKWEILEWKDWDIFLLDFKKNTEIKNWNLKTKCNWSPWNGLSVKWKIQQIWVMWVEKKI